MVTLTLVHWAFLAISVLIITGLVLRKEIVLFCLLGVFVIGMIWTGGNLVSSVQATFNAVMHAAIELLIVAIVIALVTSMSKALAEIGSDKVMIKPFAMIVRNKTSAFFVIGIAMLIFSWFLWPSPAVALIGALLLPVALKVGIPALWAAVAMNLFGHGLGLSVDFFIQGAPQITASAAGVEVNEILTSSIPIWAVFGVVTIGIAFFLFRKDMKKLADVEKIDDEKVEKEEAEVETTKFGLVMGIVTPLAFIGSVIMMLVLELRGGDATALIGGTALLITAIIAICKGNFFQSLDDIANYFREGFRFSMKIFAPVFVIASFFFLGMDEIAVLSMGEGFPNILRDFGMALSETVPLSRVPVAMMQSVIGIMVGLDGSGFSGLPIAGAVAQTLTYGTDMSVAALAAQGQVVTVAVGGGTIIPWGVIAVAAICGVNPTDLARKNLVPVLCGIAAATIISIILL